MQLKVDLIVGTLLVASVLVTSVIGRLTCPDERKCGDKICTPTQVCQVLFPPCAAPPPTTVRPYCPPILECIETYCPMQKPPETQILCIEGYDPKFVEVPKCPYKIHTCVPQNCGNN